MFGKGSPSLQNQQSSRRKAQKLAEKGATEEALAEYGRLAREGHLEPYDLVVYGDLLSRTGNRSEAVSRYLEAMDSYAKAGLNRNAIALGKKIRRLAPHETFVHRKLGELYTAEGLASESCLHYLEFLEHVDVKADGVADAIEDVCGKLLTLSLPSYQVVPKIVQAAKTVGREKRLGEGVLHQMRRAVATGNREAEQALQGLLGSLDPTLAARADTQAPVKEASPFELDATSLTERAREQHVTRQNLDAPALSLRDFSFDEPESQHENGDAEAVEATPPFDHDSSDSEAFEQSAEALREQGMSSLERKDTVRAQRFFMKAAYRFFEAAQSHEAAELYERVIKIDPNHLDALRGLVEIAHINGEKAKMAHWGSELGDVLLAREMFADAKVQFQRVLAFDPQNAKAQSRLRRLNTIAEVKDVGYGGLAPSTREVEGAQVVVRDDETTRSSSSQSTLNLSQILDEFRAAVVHRIPENDAQSHYDLGMTYKEMGLLDEAVREFEIASQNEGNRPASLDIMGECYLLLSQFDRAAEVFESVLAETGGNAPVHMRLGKAYEALGDWDRAEEEYHRALELDENLEEALELLQSLELRRTQGAA